MISSSDPITNIKNTLEKYDRIGVWLSGGTDSAIGLYLLQLHNIKTTILPVHGLNLNRWKKGAKILRDEISENVIKIVREKFTNKSHLLNDLYCFDYDLDYELEVNKTHRDYHKPVEDKLIDEGKIQIMMGFATKNPPAPILTNHQGRDSWRDKTKANNKIPFIQRDKKWIASQYKKYYLMEDLFPITVTCNGVIGPCKQCFPCQEKKWAFDVYDAGVRQ